ncbi:MAG: globin [Halioglobus sp.]|nr:globin [Halioglobus sp.]
MLNYDDVFSGSLKRVLGDGAYNPAFIADFYQTFLNASPFVAEKFADTDMSAQRTMLHDSLLMLIEFNRTRVPDARLQQLAQIHSRQQLDIPPQFYDVWLDSLVSAVGSHDPDFDEEVELAWRIALAPGICLMRFSY